MHIIAAMGTKLYNRGSLTNKLCHLSCHVGQQLHQLSIKEPYRLLLTMLLHPLSEVEDFPHCTSKSPVIQVGDISKEKMGFSEFKTKLLSLGIWKCWQFNRKNWWSVFFLHRKKYI